MTNGYFWEGPCARGPIICQKKASSFERYGPFFTMLLNRELMSSSKISNEFVQKAHHACWPELSL